MHTVKARWLTKVFSRMPDADNLNVGCYFKNESLQANLNLIVTATDRRLWYVRYGAANCLLLIVHSCQAFAAAKAAHGCATANIVCGPDAATDAATGHCASADRACGAVGPSCIKVRPLVNEFSRNLRLRSSIQMAACMW